MYTNKQKKFGDFNLKPLIAFSNPQNNEQTMF